MLSALDSVADLEWRVAFCGENFRNIPEEFTEARRRFGSRVVHFGHAKRDDYVALLAEATVALSTARQEFFGIAMVEAAASGALPLMPARLSYPEVFPQELHGDVLYEDVDALQAMLRTALTEPGHARDVGGAAAAAVQQYRWEHIVGRYDEGLAIVAERVGSA
jgi:glycosyltransferase involved in cell wall biosynthesis